jgi:hypothetical protein
VRGRAAGKPQGPQREEKPPGTEKIKNELIQVPFFSVLGGSDEPWIGR